MSRRDDTLFELAESNNSEPCPRCQGSLVIKHIGQNSFWGCKSYPQCTYTRSLHEEEAFAPEPLPDSFCPLCEKPLLLKKGRYGFFIGCSGFPLCDYMADPEPDPESPLCDCPQCGKGQLVERTNKFGKHFYPCNRYPSCKFALNQKPVAQPCPDCGYPVLVEKASAAGKRLSCPQKTCDYKSKPL
ncbi:hypothetical protein CWE12_06465 [Aliidiomarina sedimenti]|uniref:DNA topoisomerase type IA zn finger domain-containing protein n=1 Tax=Aliidiomarina sedimenti TaxID=1933879 RepID=A0ABY0C0V6_9GAMM|nr:type I DNA topoisomerase [Aliidiomarina sedimenti]RUO30875.1 hypothetical protein CWE12_06465 [Aliidiomarina sedimenti]